MTSEADIRRYLVAEFGEKSLSAITRPMMQVFLESKSKDLTESVVAHLRWHLNVIFRLAVADGFAKVNPAEALVTPACKPSGEKRVMTEEQVREALRLLDIRERLVFRMAVFEGMRPGEILAVRIGKVQGNSVLVDQRVYAGKLDTPKGRKGKRTSRVVALSPGTMSELETWKTLLPSLDGEAFLFPSEAGTPMRADNMWKKRVRPRFRAVGLEWVNFQVLRRTNASLSRKANVDDKVSADQRGHGLGVSLSVYAISDLAQKADAVKKLEAEITREGALSS